MLILLKGCMILMPSTELRSLTQLPACHLSFIVNKLTSTQTFRIELLSDTCFGHRDCLCYDKTQPDSAMSVTIISLIPLYASPISDLDTAFGSWVRIERLHMSSQSQCHQAELLCLAATLWHALPLFAHCTCSSQNSIERAMCLKDL